jgi:hypothetical protein
MNYNIILQSLEDIGRYGPFQNIYMNNTIRNKTMNTNVSVVIIHNVCEIACKVYLKAVSLSNLQYPSKKSALLPLLLFV